MLPQKITTSECFCSYSELKTSSNEQMHGKVGTVIKVGNPHLIYCMIVSIKDIDENAFRNLKAEAIRMGMKVGDAAS